jgi:hypothetical protein
MKLLQFAPCYKFYFRSNFFPIVIKKSIIININIIIKLEKSLTYHKFLIYEFTYNFKNPTPKHKH